MYKIKNRVVKEVVGHKEKTIEYMHDSFFFAVISILMAFCGSLVNHDIIVKQLCLSVC